MAGAGMMRITMQQITDYAAQHDMHDYVVRRLVAEEAFLRRAAMVDGPFMLKGSYVTGQQIDQGWRRMPGDLDWVGLGALDAKELTAWATAVTETECDDGIRFDSFSKNAFWRNIDYAMDEDFPTVNTDIDAWIGDDYLDVDIDVSFGLRLEPPPQTLLYQPRMGDAFMVNKSVAIELQMAWKLHQCLVRPRFKDMMDIILVLRANTVDAAVVWAVLEEECRRDKTPLERFNWLLDQMIALHPAWEKMKRGHYSMDDCFAEWRARESPHPGLHLSESRLANIYSGGPELLWPEFGQLLAELAMRLQGAGFAHVAPEPGYAPPGKPASMSVRLWGLLGRRG
ncbi:nucleotidyl transferase AbiEii/AbiGii toxin family protein [Massilia sp. CCM 8692]|uniref:Nucleotidyl transferase AbiEii/AbiGii toxin family protein n=2 Tax=Massilia rubra TaxID=2607910 RepID=A0ABX0LD72_9BURK|nr:nucleotidyl transferase AbiEii/AbiGii toxin family protein [Massilia rubra]